MSRECPTVLAIAGLDPSGGAGLLADVAVVSLLRCQAYGLATCLTVQDLRTFRAVNPVPVGVLEEQLESVLADGGPDAVKIGLVPTPEIARMLARRLAPCVGRIPVVLDPVLVPSRSPAATDQEPPEERIRALRDELLPVCTVVTPNLPELQRLAPGSDAVAAARSLLQGATLAVLVKGGHAPAGPMVEDLLVGRDELQRFQAPRLQGPKVHGTGCTLASALAAFLALGRDLESAARDALALLRRLRAGAVTPAPGGMARLRFFPG